MTAPFADGRRLLGHNGGVECDAVAGRHAAREPVRSAWLASAMFVRLRAGMPDPLALAAGP
ncbi:hypothetical protein AB0395_05870 [Streptosporangium sp. NPDC051023]|uniref:hypothetical protein n=1 Tax=Streptosporangium sp. NPDC051023 TaxID=3155410 RepID=UPI00344FC089